nr:unnamed protein product [Spirometra erinaceieuropaei]
MSTKVVNLSKRDLSSTEISLLSKGIRFSHTDAAPTDFLANLESLLLTSDVPDDMCADIRSCATGLLRQRKHHQTLPTEEKKALRSLKTDNKIVIMSADKGGATVIMDKVDYVNKANQIFDDREAYAPLAADPTKKQAATIKKKVNELARLKLISPDDSRSMTLNDPRIAQFGDVGETRIHDSLGRLEYSQRSNHLNVASPEDKVLVKTKVTGPLSSDGASDSMAKDPGSESLVLQTPGWVWLTDGS